MKKVIALLIFLSSCSIDPLKKDFETLDNEIEKIPQYNEEFNNVCGQLRKSFLEADSDSVKFELALELQNKYSPNNLDSAYRYSYIMHEYAGDDKSKTAISLACKAICEIKKKDLERAELLMRQSPDPLEISNLGRKYFFRTWCWISSLQDKYFELEKYTNEYWQLDSTSAEALLLMARYKYQSYHYDEAIKYSHLAEEKGNSAYYSATSNHLLAAIHNKKGDNVSRKKYLILSALADIRNNSKEYESFYTLSRALYNEKDYERALKYIQMTVDDAIYANYSGRIPAAIQANKMFNESFRQTQISRHRILLLSIIVLTILILLSAVLLIQLRIANIKLAASRHMLQERTIIQDRFLGEYMGLASDYIGEVDRMRGRLRKTLHSGGLEELSAMLKAPGFANSEINNYYNNFDQTFTSIFPGFADRVSEMLETPATSVGIRILALIRLGITDPKRISRILYISTGTVYTYIYRMRKDSGLSPKDFIDKVQSLCSL